MKRYRCPNCGEPSIDAFTKNTIHLHKYNQSFLRRINKEEMWEICHDCNKPYTIRAPYRNIGFKIFEVIIVIILFTILLVLGLLTARFKVLIIPFIFCVLIIVPAFVFGISYLENSKCNAVEVDADTHRLIEPIPNVLVDLEEIAKDIHNYDIHSLKFDTNTYNVVFLERFKDRLVPIMFLKNTKEQITPIAAKIIRIEFLPQELLFVGSKFKIIDTSGNIIGKGKIHKII